MTTIAGVVSEVIRTGPDDYHASQCCVFGIDREEFDTIKSMPGKYLISGHL